MDQNPISIVVVLAGMAFLFLGMMQYMVMREKANGTERFKLMDDLAAAKLEISKLRSDISDLQDDLEEAERKIKRYHDFAKMLLAKYQAITKDNLGIEDTQDILKIDDKKR